MNFYQVAMQMEANGRSFYLTLMEKSEHPKLKQLFKMLADEESAHYELFKRMSEQAPVGLMSEMGGAVSAEMFFQEVISFGIDFNSEQNLIDAYREAKELEDQTVLFYKKCLNETSRSADKVILLKLYYEEKKHSLFLEHLIEMMTDTACQIASAEWDRPDSIDL